MSQPSTAGVSFFSGLRRTLEPQPLAPVLPATAARAHLRAVSLPPQQLGDVGGDAPGLVAGERCAHVYAPARLLRVGFE